MELEIDGQKFDGFAVLPKKQTYHIKIKAKGKLDLFTLTSCHREFTAEKIKGGLFSKVGSEFETTYTPILGIEDQNCPVFLGGFEELQGRHSWGVIDFEDPINFKLEAEVLCNGTKRIQKGVSICQSKVGLLQQIKFKEKVLTSFDDGLCTMNAENDQQTFTFDTPQGECSFVYMSIETGDMHRLTTLGYEKILIRGEK